ncbi:ROK family protein [Aquamicrobium sp. NLF2-7]|uniref:ROK family protein n=1 Tax=Aquamicrobium sp. NLF2-7 TaxID=2918753 RepID=UPI001EFA81AA|nr:ROK family protein [Aquamicrobium sp. NLF2-7]MCG8273939.1 ROK family protein [Aquamicrobium sp. NLF2-7]
MTYEPTDHIAARFLRDGRGRAVASRNERDLLRLIWGNPGIARASLTDQPFDLTQQSLHRIVDKLHERGMISFLEADASRSGPKSPRLSPNRDWCLTIGVSINVGSIGIALLGFGELLGLEALPDADMELAEAFEAIERAFDRLLAKRDLDRDAILGIGVGVAGYRMSAEGSFNTPQPLHRWSMIDLAPLFGRRFGLPVWTDNGSQTAALAEAVFGVGRNSPDFAYVAHNYGYGGGLIFGGKPFRGSFGNAGELSGLFDLDESRYRPALHLLLEDLRKAGRHQLTLSELIRSVSPDWIGVTDWIEKVAPAHNKAMNALSSVFDPGVIVLGGELPPVLGRMLIERTVFHSRPRHGMPRRTPQLTVAEVTEEPSAIGAALLPLLETVL